MKIKQFYCWIGPKSGVSGSLGGISTKTTSLHNLGSVSINNNPKSKDSTPDKLPQETSYLKDIDLTQFNKKNGNNI